MVRRSAGALSRPTAGLLDEHLRACPYCRAFAAVDERILAGFAAMRSGVPPRVDVSARVAREAASIGAIARREVPPRQIAWAMAGAAALAALAAVGTWWAGPVLVEAARTLTAGIVTGTALSLRIVGDAASNLAGGETLFRACIGSIESLWTLVRRAEPFARAAAVLSVLIMTIITTFVVGRDLRRSEPARTDPGERQ